jgi:hypothetical protein
VIGWGYMFNGGKESNKMKMVKLMKYYEEKWKRVMNGYVKERKIWEGVNGGGKGKWGGDYGGKMIVKKYKDGIV